MAGDWASCRLWRDSSADSAFLFRATLGPVTALSRGHVLAAVRPLPWAAAPRGAEGVGVTTSP